MGARWLVSFVLGAIALNVFSLSAQQAAEGAENSTAPSTQEFDASRVFLPCTPVAAYWTGSPPSQGMPPGPNLAVVSINTRPKNARVHLDGKFVGRARYLDGKPGYLYLEPGLYELELRLEGHTPVLVVLDARASCKYDLKHRLQSTKQASTVESEKSFGKGKPFQRVYKPLMKAEPATEPPRRKGPDTSLREDLDTKDPSAATAIEGPGAALRLKVRPESASVFIDGKFVATARELQLMEGPLATTAGTHRVVVRAPGFVEVTKEIEFTEDEINVLEISLSEKRTK